MNTTEKSNVESMKLQKENQEKPENNLSEMGGGDGDKKIGADSSSARWGQESLSTKDCGQNPSKLRSPGERELSGYDDNTTTVGQPGDRRSLTLIDRADKLRSESAPGESE